MLHIRIIVYSRIVKVDLPSLAGRERVLRVHAEKLSGFTEGHGVDPSREKRYDRNEKNDRSRMNRPKIARSISLRLCFP